MIFQVQVFEDNNNMNKQVLIKAVEESYSVDIKNSHQLTLVSLIP